MLQQQRALLRLQVELRLAAERQALCATLGPVTRGLALLLPVGVLAAEEVVVQQNHLPGLVRGQ